jgi:poly-gamma-glutamate synthesis protein (capsule biosynthesis protein)
MSSRTSPIEPDVAGAQAAGSYTLALTGDVIMNSPISVCRDADVLAAVNLLRGADVTHAHLEIPLHDFVGADVFGAAEGALSWMRGPTRIASELCWLGVDVVSAASNHALDYSYGGLRSTLAALDAVGLPHAGIGGNLAAARAPAFVDAAVGRIAVVSATSSFPTFARAGAARRDADGRPGVNPLRYVHVVDSQLAEQVMSIAARLGMWVVNDGEEFVIHPPGLHNSVSRFQIRPQLPAPTTACDEDDLAGNVESIRYAHSVADLVVAHLHLHAWDGVDGRMSTTPEFAREYAYAAIDAGAQVVLVQGSHAPMRGIEIHNGVPVFYDPGPLSRLGRREAQPHDFYTRWGNRGSVRSYDAGLLEAFSAREVATSGGTSRNTVHSPREGINHDPGFVVPICTVDAAAHRVCRIELYPMAWSMAHRTTTGFPVRATGERGRAILARMAELSEPYGTAVRIGGNADIAAIDLVTGGRSDRVTI